MIKLLLVSLLACLTVGFPLPEGTDSPVLCYNATIAAQAKAKIQAEIGRHTKASSFRSGRLPQTSSDGNQFCLVETVFSLNMRREPPLVMHSRCKSAKPLHYPGITRPEWRCAQRTRNLLVLRQERRLTGPDKEGLCTPGTGEPMQYRFETELQYYACELQIAAH